MRLTGRSSPSPHYDNPPLSIVQQPGSAVWLFNHDSWYLMRLEKSNRVTNALLRKRLDVTRRPRGLADSIGSSGFPPKPHFLLGATFHT
jgi:hypothetical protein